MNHAGEVFGYKELYVADGAIVPRALGVNPSRTIGALAARISVSMNKGGSQIPTRVSGTPRRTYSWPMKLQHPSRALIFGND